MHRAFPGRGKVAILRTRPETVLEDYARADGTGRLPPGAAPGHRDHPQDQHLLADLVPGLLDRRPGSWRASSARCRPPATGT